MLYSLIAGVLVGVLMLIASLILKYTAVKRNYLFGYRTPRSLKNDENWIYANKKAASYLLYISYYSIILGTLSILLEFDTKYVVFPTMGLLILSIILVELNLYKFDKKKSIDSKNAPNKQ